MDRSLRERLQTAAELALVRAVEKAGNRLKGRAGVLRDTLRRVDALEAAAVAGPNLIAAAGLTTDDLLAGAFDDLVVRYKTWAGGAVDEALGITATLVGEWRTGYPEAMKATLAQHLDESAQYLQDALTGMAVQSMFDPKAVLFRTGPDLIPTGFVRHVLGIAGGTADISGSGFAYVALKSTGDGLPGLATGPVITGALKDHGATVEGYRWVYGPSRRVEPFKPHLALDGKVFQQFDDQVLANPHSWPPFAHYIPGDHAHCRCDFEPIILTREQAKALGLAVDDLPEPEPVPAPEPAPEPVPVPPPPAPVPAPRRLKKAVEIAESPTPSTTYKRKAGTADPSSLVGYADDKTRAMYEHTMQRLGELHGAPELPSESWRTEIRRGRKTETKGGHFSPGKRPAKPRRTRGKSSEQWLAEMREWRATPLKPEILMCDRGDGTQLLTLIHEFGHRLDWVPGPNPGSGGMLTHAVGARSFGPPVGAVRDFLEAARVTETIKGAGVRWSYDSGFVNYFRSSHEVWARAYSQWAADELGGEWRAALEASRVKWPGNQWPDDEFATLKPHVEAILREWGLIE